MEIKHDISITESDEIFAEVIHSAWYDFSGDNFNAGVDAIALITGPLSSADINNVRPILEWARHSENEDEFFTKVNAPDFSSNAKRKKLEAFKTQLKKANNDADISNFMLWEFLKIFHLLTRPLNTRHLL